MIIFVFKKFFGIIFSSISNFIQFKVVGGNAFMGKSGPVDMDPLAALEVGVSFM
jgi:hypothetical protein